MAKNLLIVESPNKVDKLQKFLGKDWVVTASVGHIRDLATWGTPLRLGLDLDTMEPEYIELKDKAEVIENLRELSKKVDHVYLATDPDREGEAIAFHIQSIIEGTKAKIHRVTFNEITKESVLEAIANPRKLDQDLINSQETRRILDRIIGFRLSYLTNKKISARSAGRVKSAVLKLIIDRENEIESFVPDYWWTLEGLLKDDESIINVTSDKFTEIKYEKEEEANKLLKSMKGEFTFVERKESKRTVKPPQPLEMATYLMAMYGAHNTPNASATIAAQSLYEKGYITYPRTDSKRISSKEFIKSAEKYINENYGKEYWEGVPVVKGKKGDQDAHEAIRPVDISVTPSSLAGLKVNEKRAYTLIWMTTVKAFMIDAKNKVVKDIYKDGKAFFALKRSYPLEEGFRVADGIVPSKENKPEETLKINLKDIKVLEHSTKPPGRYNPSSLIKLMKDVGIGRPSTYSGVTSGLVGYGYLENNGGALKPTPMAQEVNDLLQGHFGDIVNEQYTAGMEKTLDKIAQGGQESRKYLLKFWKDFGPRIDKANEEIPKKPPIYTGKSCVSQECPGEGKGKLVVKRGPFGEFIACDQFPKCKHTEALNPKPEPRDTGEVCPECGKHLVVRESNRTKTKFIACSGFPRCTYIYPEERTIEVLLDLGEITKEQKVERITKLEKRVEREKTRELKLQLELKEQAKKEKKASTKKKAKK